MKLRIAAALMLVTAAAMAGQSVRAQSAAADRAKVLRAAADALGMVRWSDIGAPNYRLPGIDIINTMEFVSNGTVEAGGRSGQAEYHVALGYNPPAMRVEITRDGRKTFQTVRENFAWDESELGAGLIPGKGTATPMAAALQDRLLQLWTMPFGVVKGALAAGDKTFVSSEGGATVLTFPLTGALAGVTVRATLDANSLVTRVDTRSDNPARANLVTQTEYSNYADRAEVLTDIKTPGRIVRRQGGRTLLDVVVKVWETNNPYLVFPVPANVRTAAPANSR